MAKAVTIVDSGGLPVTNTSSLLAGTAMTPVDAGGMPVTLLDSGGYPVALIEVDGTLWAGGTPSFPYTPLVDLDSSLISGVSGRYVPNVQETVPATSSIMQFTSGFIYFTNAGGATVTQRFANGPAGGATAARVQMTSTGTAHIELSDSAGFIGYTFQFKAKSAPGAGSQTFRYGRWSASFNTANVTESGWTTLSYASGVSGAQFCGLWADGTNAVDVLIDEVQMEPTPAGTFVSTAHAFPEFAKASTLTVTSGALDTTTTAIKAGIILPSYPATTTFSEGTIWAVVSNSDTTINNGKYVGFETGSPAAASPAVGVSGGQIWGTPSFVVGAQADSSRAGSSEKIAGKGFHVLISTFKNGAQAFYFDGIPHNKTSLAFTALERDVLGFMGDPVKSFGVSGTAWGSNGVKSLLTKAGVDNHWITDAEAQQLYEKLVADHAATGAAAITPVNYVCCEGDSISFDSASYYFNTFTTWGSSYNVIGRNAAVSGTSLMVGGMSRQAAMLERVQAAVALGHNPIVSVFHGANGLPTVAEYHAYTDPLRAAGAKIVVCAVLHKAGLDNSATDTANTNYYNEGSNLWDAFCDWRGALTETIGVHYTDNTHPNAAGHTVLAPIWQATIEPLLV